MSKSHKCDSLAKHTKYPSGEGVQPSGGCRPFVVFVAATAVQVSHQVSLDGGSLIAAVAAPMDVGVVLNCSSHRLTSELTTGPPPDNLVVDLHRWVI